MRAIASLPLLSFSLLLMLAGQSHGQKKDQDKTSQQEPITITGAGGLTLGKTSVDYVRSNRGIALVIWWDGVGAAEGGSDESNARGSYSPTKDKRIEWQWKGAKHKGGDFKIDGKPYDLAKGTLILVSTKDTKVQVTQLDVDLSKLEPDKKGFEALAKEQPKVAKFIAEVSGQKE
jgi:hypothetical protein